MWDNISKLVVEQDGNLCQERRAREAETGFDVANQSRRRSKSKIKRLFSSRPSMKLKRAYDSERIITPKTMNMIDERVYIEGYEYNDMMRC